MDRISFKWIFRKCLLLLSGLPHWSRDFTVYLRLSVSAFLRKLSVFVRFLFWTFAILSNSMSQSVKLSWLSALTIPVVTYNSHKLLITESIISLLYCVGHCVTRRRLTNSEWWIVGTKLKRSMGGEMSVPWLWPVLSTCLLGQSEEK